MSSPRITPADSPELFDRIARRYDFINRLISLGQEQEWRRRGVEFLPRGRILDLGSGTGAAAPVFGDREVVALDPSPEMIARSPMTDRVVGVGERLPFSDESFDGVFTAYVMRNLVSIPSVLLEVHRVLRPGGKLVIIGLGRPRSRLAAAVHRTGSAVALPLAGALIGTPSEYWYLHKSLDSLEPPERLYQRGPLIFERVWRMGPLGFVHGVVLAKRS